MFTDPFERACAVVYEEIRDDWAALYRCLPWHPPRGEVTLDREIEEFAVSAGRIGSKVHSFVFKYAVGLLDMWYILNNQSLPGTKSPTSWDLWVRINLLNRFLLTKNRILKVCISRVLHLFSNLRKRNSVSLYKSLNLIFMNEVRTTEFGEISFEANLPFGLVKVSQTLTDQTK